ncbi:type IV pilin [Haloarcula salina]|uniref:type IV pilin n=1 Tax=Haloarcula salina TaxID=1429914 RepID=UPI003C6F8EAD
MDLTNLKALLTDDDAVSPVIGVILMVAITVILAAVIASFVLGLGDTASQTTPQASFSFDYSETDKNLKITHDGGDSILSDELYVRGTAGGNANTGVWHSLPDATTASGSEVTAGNSVYLGQADGSGTDVPTTYEISVVYETQEGDNSATLGEDSGPDA